MAIRPGELQTPEDFGRLENRDGDGEPMRSKGPTAELRAMKERIAAMRKAPAPSGPKASDAYSRDWHERGFKAGWAACLEAIEKD